MRLEISYGFKKFPSDKIIISLPDGNSYLNIVKIN